MTSDPVDLRARYRELCRLVGRLEIALDSLEQYGRLDLSTDSEGSAQMVGTYQQCRMEVRDHFDREHQAAGERSISSASGAQNGLDDDRALPGPVIDDPPSG